MSRRPRIIAPDHPILPLQFEHHVCAAQGSPGDFLSRKPHTRGWFLRVTVLSVSGKQVIGRRIKLNLRTADKAEAIERRDVVLLGYFKAGLIDFSQRVTKAVPFLEGELPEESDMILGPRDLIEQLRAANAPPAPPPSPAPRDPEASLFATH